MSDTVKLLLGPALALIPILVWELRLKPQRTRHRVASLLLAEIHYNIDELFQLKNRQEHNPKAVILGMQFSKRAFDAMSGSIGELPAAQAKSVLAHYAHLARVEALLTHLKAFQEKRLPSGGGVDDDLLRLAVEKGILSLAHSTDAAIGHAFKVRTSLFEVLAAEAFDEPEPLEPRDRIESKALKQFKDGVEQLAARRAKS
jgi:hypothetical protein